MKKLFLSTFIILSAKLSCQAMPENDRDAKSILQRAHGKSLRELQEMQAALSYPYLPASLGNMLTIDTGNLNVLCPGAENEEPVRGIYREMKEKIVVGYNQEELTINAVTQTHSNAFCRGRRRLILRAQDNFIGDHALFGSEGDVYFTSPQFRFSSSFIDVTPLHTTIVISPPESLKSPIAWLKFKPSQSPVLLQGEIDFKHLDFRDFTISHSEVNILFK